MKRSMIRDGQRGVILVTVLILAVLIAIFCMVSLVITTSESRSTQQSIQMTTALFVAQSGIEDELNRLTQIQGAASLANPFAAIDGLTGKTVLESVVLTKDNAPLGEYSVTVSKVEALGTMARDLTLVSTGWVPSAGTTGATRRVVTTVVRMSLGRAGVFDYVYFINNWGWFYANSITANGNVRSNGQFDGGHYSSRINPLPRFNQVEEGELGARDDEGGLYSGWNIVNQEKMTGLDAKWTPQDAANGLCEPQDVGELKHVHSFYDQVHMPNLTNLEPYEALATGNNSKISIGGVQMCDAVVGDVTLGNDKENPNLYLVGTSSKPIVLDGPVVVRGDVMISGYVTGKGSIYAGGNVYVAGDIIYKNAVPAMPVKTDTTTLQKWLTDAAKADALGLFAREHIVVGNYKDSDWQKAVSKWVGDSRNASEEDAGADQIPNTYVGRDGIKGTADDDVLENDNKFTVDRYTTQHQHEGMLPPGAQVGDVIAESGEDIDGDATYDPTVKMTEFEIPTTDFEINNGHWEGNVPTAKKKYSDLSTNTITRLDAAFYTNHTFAMLTDASGKDMVFNGCIVSRNEAIVYGTKSLILNYDMRLMDNAEMFGFYLPKTWQPVQVVVWSCDGNGTMQVQSEVTPEAPVQPEPDEPEVVEDPEDEPVAPPPPPPPPPRRRRR